MSNVLSDDARAAVIGLLVEGASICSIARVTGTNKNTIARLGCEVGLGCVVMHDAIVQGVRAKRVEADELQTFVQMRARQWRAEHGDSRGPQFIYAAIDAESKLLLSYKIGKRTAANTVAFMADLRRRVVGRPELSTDGCPLYPDAVAIVFGKEVHFGQCIKEFRDDFAFRKRALMGNPGNISTQNIERLNLSMRQGLRRLARGSNGFSRRKKNLVAAFALWAFHYNFCRIHKTLRCTPAMEAGLASHIWDVRDVVRRALEIRAERAIGGCSRTYGLREHRQQGGRRKKITEQRMGAVS